MTDSELQRLQDTLGIVLPAPYAEVMRAFPPELRHWPSWADGESRTFYSDVDVILDANKKVRENPGQFVKFPRQYRAAWPKNLFLFGDDNSESFYLIDVNKPNPEVDSIFNGAIRPSFPDVASLYRSFQYRHGERWKEDAMRSTKPPKVPKATLSAAVFLKEAKHLARPATVLSAEGAVYAACWRGTGVVPPPPGQWEHWISIDQTLYPAIRTIAAAC